MALAIAVTAVIMFAAGFYSGLLIMAIMAAGSRADERLGYD